MTAAEVVTALRANYFEPQGFGVRADIDASEFARVLVRVQRQGTSSRLFGLRFVDYPLSPPALRFWRLERWDDADFTFDFTSIGDTGAGTTTSSSGVPTMCIPYHVDYYKNGWHTDKPWTVELADSHIADLIGNVLQRA